MQCRHCGKPLGILRKLADQEFCSATHQKAYMEEQERLALQRLLELRTPEQSPANRTLTSLLPPPEDADTLLLTIADLEQSGEPAEDLGPTDDLLTAFFQEDAANAPPRPAPLASDRTHSEHRGPQANDPAPAGFAWERPEAKPPQTSTHSSAPRSANPLPWQEHGSSLALPEASLSPVQLVIEVRSPDATEFNLPQQAPGGEEIDTTLPADLQEILEGIAAPPLDWLLDAGEEAVAPEIAPSGVQFAEADFPEIDIPGLLASLTDVPSQAESPDSPSLAINSDEPRATGPLALVPDLLPSVPLQPPEPLISTFCRPASPAQEIAPSLDALTWLTGLPLPAPAPQRCGPVSLRLRAESQHRQVCTLSPIPLLPLSTLTRCVPPEAPAPLQDLAVDASWTFICQSIVASSPSTEPTPERPCARPAIPLHMSLCVSRRWAHGSTAALLPIPAGDPLVAKEAWRPSLPASMPLATFVSLAASMDATVAGPRDAQPQRMPLQPMTALPAHPPTIPPGTRVSVGVEAAKLPVGLPRHRLGRPQAALLLAGAGPLHLPPRLCPPSGGEAGRAASPPQHHSVEQTCLPVQWNGTLNAPSPPSPARQPIAVASLTADDCQEPVFRVPLFRSTLLRGTWNGQQAARELSPRAQTS